MYCNFFGISEKPFDVTPDPKFLYMSPSHQEMLASLIYGIRERRGFIAIVGEVGTGKTTLLNAVLDRFDERTKVAFIFNTDVTFEQMLMMVLIDLDVARPEEALSKVEALNRLNEFAIGQLSQGGNVVLIVDEAQNLDRECMESLRLLSNLETRKHKLVQIVLSGQPELDAKLSRVELRQLAQRISIKRYITPLTQEETYGYMAHRLKIVGYKGPSLFSREARELIWQYSAGVPRRINILCDNAFLIGYGLRKKKITAKVVAEAIKDLSWSPFAENNAPQTDYVGDQLIHGLKARTSHSRLALTVGLILALCLLLVVGLTVYTSQAKLKQWGTHLYHTLVGVEATSIPEGITQSPMAVRHAPFLERSRKAKDEPTVTEKRVDLEGKAGEKQVYDTSKRDDHARAKVQKEKLSSGNPEEDIEVKKKTLVTHMQTVSGSGVSVKQVESAPLPSNHEKELAKEDEAVKRQDRYVVAKRGDYLSLIIQRVYGTYSEQILRSILHKNPEIRDPNYIRVGQAVLLP